MKKLSKELIVSGALALSALMANPAIAEDQVYEKAYTNISCTTGEDSYIFTDDEIDLIALVTMAEAEGESEYGKRLVIDTIINRVKSDEFPDTVHDVIYQPYHFESMWNGRVDVCYVDEDICDLVREEIAITTDEYAIFFCAGDYSLYGTPMYQVGNHYFSTY